MLVLSVIVNCYGVSKGGSVTPVGGGHCIQCNNQSNIGKYACK